MVNKVYETSLSKLYTTIDIEHHKVHEGNFFISSYQWESIGTDNKLIFINPIASTHLRGAIFAISSGQVDIKMWEGPNITDNGNSVISSNLNRISEKTSPLEIYVNSSADIMGLNLYDEAIYGDKKTSAFGTKYFPELILDTSNTYAISVNTLINTGDVYMLLTYYRYEA